jgi:endonuclease/exonuclease/phosphatase family metal-dependent hydrolase
MDRARTVAWRILTWNVRGSAAPDIAALADVVQSYSPDVVALQEIQPLQARRLAALLGWQHYWGRKHYPYSHALWWRAEGLSTMSPHRLSNLARQSISPGVHSYTWRHRVLLAADVERADMRLRVVNTHLAAHASGVDERIVQAGRVAARVRADAAPLTVVAGDLNAPGEVEVIRELVAVGLRDPGGGPTNPSIAPAQRLDYVLIPEGARLVEQSEPDGGDWWWALSDHVPVLVAFEV